MDINNLPNNQTNNQNSNNQNNVMPENLPNQPINMGNSNIEVLPNSDLSNANLSPNTTPVTNAMPNNNVMNQQPNNLAANPNLNSMASTNLESMNLNNAINESQNLQPQTFTAPVNQAQNITPGTPQNPNIGNPAGPINLNSNNGDTFNAVPVPPVFQDDGKKKKGINKTTIIILLILLIVAIGGGVYFVLHMNSNTPVVPTIQITPKEIHLNLNDPVPSNPEYYADIVGTDVSNCTVNIQNIKNDVVGAYNFGVTCGSNMELGTAIVEDLTPPVVVSNDLEVIPGNMPTANDFIEYCFDASSCTSEITTNLDEIINTIGSYDVNIAISDAYNNTTNVVQKLIISATAPDNAITCTAEVKNIDSIFATQTDRFKIWSSNNQFHHAIKTSQFNFEEINDFNTQVNNYDPTKGINGILGDIYNDQYNKMILIRQPKTFDELMTEFNTNFTSQDINVLKSYLMFQGYTCQ